MTPNANCRLISVTADGYLMGRRDYYTFPDVRTNHTLSGFFAPIPTPGTGTGLRGDYYVGANFDVFRITRTDATVNFDWAYGSPDAAIPIDGFTVRWTGQIEPQFTETYKFYLNHDDGAKLWVNNVLVVNNWGGAGTDDNGTISLTAGQKVAIKLEYQENLNAASCKLEWFSPSLPREVVPQTQLYPATTPIYTLTASTGAGGSLSPTGTVLANSGGSQTFSVIPSVGYYIADVKVDNVSQGPITTYPFTNVTTNHAISATFTALPSYLVSGTVVRQGTGAVISGATVGFYSAPSVVGSPSYSATTNGSGNYSVSIPAGTWYVRAMASGYFTSSAQTVTIISAPVTGINFVLAPSTRNIPRTSDLLFSAVTDTFPSSGNTGGWASYLPSGQTFATLGTPTVQMINGVKWEQNIYTDYDGYRQATYSSAIATAGVTIAAVVRPQYLSVGGEVRGEVVDFFYSDLFLAVNHGTGEVIVDWRGYTQATTGYRIPDGQTTVLVLVVAQTGQMSLYANGVLKWGPYATGVDYSTLQQSGLSGAAKTICIGRNDYDGWSTYNGYIGDVFVYKAALLTAERQQLEADLTSKFITGGATSYAISATAGVGGTISPNGTTMVAPAGSQTYTIAASSGYAIAGVTVDGVSQGAISSYTFTNVNANHGIYATFIPTVASIAALKAKAADTLVKMTATETVIYAPKDTGGTRTTTWFYIGEAKGLGGLKVVDKTSDTLSLGNTVTNLLGNVRKPAGGEIYMELTADTTGSGNTPIRPIGLGCKSALNDPNVPTNTVVAWGKVKSINGTTSFVINDGYGNVTVNVNGVALPSGLDTTRTAVVTGVLSADRKIQAQTVRAVP